MSNQPNQKKRGGLSIYLATKGKSRSAKSRPPRRAARKPKKSLQPTKSQTYQASVLSKKIASTVPRLAKNLQAMRLDRSLGSSGSKRLAALIANPSASPSGFRVNNQDTNFTATANLPHYVELTASTKFGNTTLASTTTSQLFLFRDAARYFINFLANPSQSWYVYYGMYYVNGSETESLILPTTKVAINFTRFAALPIGNSVPSVITTGQNVALQPHDTYLYPGIRSGDPNESYIYADKGATFTFVLTGTSSTTDIDIYLYKGSGVMDVKVTSLTFSSSASESYTSLTEGYYKFVVVDTAGTAAFQHIYLSGSGDTFAHHAVPGFSTALPVYQNARLNGVSLLLHPTAPELYEGGTVTGVYLQNLNTQWTSLIGQAPDYNIHYKRTLPFTTGCYTFLPVDDMASMYMVKSTALDSSNTLMESNFMLDANAGYVTLLVVAPNQGTTASPSAPSLEFLVTTDVVVEYETRDMTRSTAACSDRHTTTSDAYDIVRRMPIFYENPMHLADIRRAVSSGFSKFKGAVGTAGKVVGIAESIGRLLAPLL